MKKIIAATVLTIWCLMTVSAQQAVEDSLRLIIDQGRQDAKTASAYNDLAYEYSRKDLAKSKAYLKSAIAISKKIHDARQISNSYAQLVYVFYDTGQPDSAESYLNMIYGLVHEAPEADKDAIRANFYSVSALYNKKRGAYQKAIPFFEQAIALNKKRGSKESVAGQTLNLGNTYLSLGDYQKATEQHLAALRIFEEIGSQRGMSFCYQSLCLSFTRIKQYKKALEYAHKSLKIKTLINDKIGLGTAQGALGDIYLGLGQPNKALQHYNASLAIAVALNNIMEEQGSLFKLAKTYVAKSDLSQAIAYYTRSRKLARQLGDSTSVAAIDAELIAAHAGTIKASALSEEKLKANITLFEQAGDLDRQAAGFRNLVDYYTATRQYEKALQYNDRYHRITDSIHNNGLRVQIHKMENLYSVEKKEREIAVLQQEQLLNQASLQKQEVIKYALAILVVLLLFIGLLALNRYKLRGRMKELELRNRIAADLHDEVGSSLSSIHLLSQMVMGTGNEVTRNDILSKMGAHAKETMEKMGDIVWMIKGGESEALSLSERIVRFAYDICSSKNIEVNTRLEELEKLNLDMAQRKDIYLVVKEAVNNSVKYSGSARILISATVLPNQLLIQIKDFGKGFDSNLINKGNGLDNMHHRAQELGGKLTVESSIDEGTTIELVMQA